MISQDHLSRLRIAAERRVEERDYWLQQLAGALTWGGFPYDHTPLDPQAKSFEIVHFGFSEELATGLLKISADSDIRLFIVLTTTLTILLYKYSGCDNSDILVGSPILRQEPAGEFFNTVLALRNQIAEDMTFRDFLLQVRQTIIEADKNRNYPIEILMTELDLPDKGENNPLSPVAILLENIHDKHYLDQAAPDMLFSFSRNGDSISGRVEYNSLLYDKSTIEIIIAHFENLLKAALARPDAKISTLGMLSQPEKEQLLFHFNDTGAGYPTDRTIHELFEIQAIKTPDNIAVIGTAADIRQGWGKPNTPAQHGSTFSHGSLTYKDLNEEADRLAYLLTAKGLKPGDIAAIMVERSLHIIVGILAVLKSGAAYLPINPQQPITRTKYLLQDCCVGLLLTSGNLIEEVEQLKRLELEIVFIGDRGSEPILSPAKNRSSETGNLPAAAYRSPSVHKPANLAYIIYTSGSTGMPKGVPITHANYCPLIHWGYRHLGISPADRVIQNLSYYFDWSVLEIFIALTCGACLYMITEEILLNPQAEVDFILENEITVLHITPTQYSYLIETGKQLTSLKYLFIGAEKLTSDLVRRSIESVNEECRLFNMYGPTEATIISVVLEIDRSRVAEFSLLSSVPIGGAVGNTSLLILDRCLQLCPIGLPGELYIAGDCVAAGYLNNPELTDEKFNTEYRIQDTGYRIKNTKLTDYHSSLTTHQSPFTTHLYKTGDRCRWLADGTVEFLGRVDFQVKIRGYRIEPGEIENLLLKHENVKEAHVMVRQHKNGENFLCAYLVVEHGEKAAPGLPDQGVQRRLLVSSFRDFLTAHLPDYMVPAHFVLLDRMPLNPNGKIDRNALPEPGEASVRGEYAAPRDAVEKRLAAIWGGLLGKEKDRLSIDENFFELGGHSLKAAELVSRVYKDFAVNLELAEVFAAPTIRDLSAIIKAAVKEQYIAIEPVEKREYYPASSAQRRLYLVSQWDVQGIGYNIPAGFVLLGELDHIRLAETFRRLIARHESFRTSFHFLANQVVQKIHHPETIKFKIIYNDTLEKDDSLLQDSSQQKFLRGSRGRFFQKEPPDSPGQMFSSFIRPFDLGCAPLLCAGVIELEATKTMLLVDMHHIAADGASTALLVKEFMSLYGGEELPCLKIQYKDFSGWQGSERVKMTIQQQEEYWIDRFRGEIPVLDLPTDFARPPVQSYAGGSIHFGIPGAVCHELKELAQQTGATLFMVLFGLYTIFLSKLSGQEDIVLGTVTAGRRREDLAPLIGMFVNTLAIRNFPAGEITARQFLGRVKERLLEAFANQDYPYEELVEHLQIPRETSRNPLFDTVFVLQDFATPAISISGLELQPYHYDPQTTKFDISLTASDMGEEIDFDFEYCVKLFKPETCERMIDYFKNVIYDAVENPGKRLAEIEIVSEEEKRRIVYDYNATRAEYRYALDKTIHEIFASQVRETPGCTALVFEDSHISYGCLDMKTDSLAGDLQAKGLLPGEIAALLIERSPQMIIGLLAVLKAGAVYLPFSFQYPDERIKMIVNDSRPRMLLTCHYPALEDADVVPGFNGETIYINDKEPAAPGQRLTNPTAAEVANPSEGGVADPLPGIGSAAPAYVVYTSGTTGIPKGILVEHRNVLNVVGWYGRQFNIRPGMRILQSADYIFDAGMEQIFGSLLHGAALYLVAKDILLFVEALRQYIAAKRIQVIDFVPLILKELLGDGEKLESLQTVISGADRLDDDIKEKILQKGYSLYNLYGPSEITVDALASRCSQEKVNLGQPIANVSCYILDKYDHVLPISVPGELVISGAGVSRGYLNKPDSTGEKFTIDPFRPGRLMYCSGDRCRRLPNGNIEFLGRIDQQVKIRGYRIEPAEIENILLKHGNIKEAVVICRQDKKSDNYLCAYIVSDRELPVQGLREYLLKHLPEYMVPAYIERLEKIPLTAAGKIDRRALPEPGVKASRKSVSHAAGIEKKLAKIWSQVLEIGEDKIDIHATFFELGGHSLKAAKLSYFINREFEINVELKDIFAYPSISKLAQIIKAAETQEYAVINPVEEKEYYELSYNQKRLWFLHQLEPGSPAFNMSSRFEIRHKVDIKAFKKALHQLMLHHESLRTKFGKVNEEPVQSIVKQAEIPFKEIDLTALCEEDKKEQIESIFTDTSTSPFTLNQEPLFRTVLVKLAEEHYEFMYNLHHIITDGWSMEIIKNEFSLLYEGYRTAAEVKPGRLNLDYKDFCEWNNRQLRDPNIKKNSHDFWKRKLEGGIPTLEMPVKSSGDRKSLQGAGYMIMINEELSEKLKKMAAINNTTLFVVMFSVYIMMLYRFTKQKEIACSIIGAGRDHLSLHHIIGFFVNSILFKIDVYPAESFTDFLQRMRTDVFETFQNQNYPLELVCQDLKIKYPDISVSFNMLNIQEKVGDRLDSFEPYHIEKVQDVKFDLEPYVSEFRNGIDIYWAYKRKLFQPSHIEHIVDEYIKLIDFFTGNSSKSYEDYQNRIKKQKLMRK